MSIIFTPFCFSGRATLEYHLRPILSLDVALHSSAGDLQLHCLDSAALVGSQAFVPVDWGRSRISLVDGFFRYTLYKFHPQDSYCSREYPFSSVRIVARCPVAFRMRTTFDPENELPRLQNRWFLENQLPIRRWIPIRLRFLFNFQVEKLMVYFVDCSCNCSSRNWTNQSSRGRKPLDVSNLVIGSKTPVQLTNGPRCGTIGSKPTSTAGRPIHQGCMGEESSDDNRRMDMPAGEHDDDE